MASVDLGEDTFEGTTLSRSLVLTTMSSDGSSAQEPAHAQQLLSDILLLYFRCLLCGCRCCSGSLLPQSLHLLVRLLELRLLDGQTLFVECRKLLVVRNLLLQLRNGGLKNRFLQCLCLLILVDLLLRNELVERLVGVVGDDGVHFGGSVLG